MLFRSRGVASILAVWRSQGQPYSRRREIPGSVRRDTPREDETDTKSSRSACEILRTHLLQEFAELLDLVLLLVRNDDAGLGEHLVGAADGAPTRSASAMESLGRAETRTPSPISRSA